MQKVLISILTVLLLGCSFAVQAQNNNLSKRKAEKLGAEIFAKEVAEYLKPITENWDKGTLINGDFKMPFWVKVTGDAPEGGYPLYISMHGGGGAPKELNDQQWENQKRLYGDVPGIYFVPRAPTDTWNLWHQEYMDEFLTQVAAYSVANLNADQNRIYLMGYSAGGDGTFNLAPRLSDRFAAAAMMAGHPGDAVAENLNNLPFAIYMGGEDSAYNRNGLAAEWGVKLDELSKQYPGEFKHHVVIYEGKGHWMDNEDKEAIGWLAACTRDYNPEHLIWVQDDVLSKHKYNLEVENPKVGNRVEVCYNKAKNRIDILQNDAKGLTIWLNDELMNLDKPIQVYQNNKLIFNAKVKRLARNIRHTVKNSYDADRIYSASIKLKGTSNNSL